MEINFESLANLFEGMTDDDIVFDVAQKQISQKQRATPAGSFSYGHQASAELINQFMDEPLVPRILAPGDYIQKIPHTSKYYLRVPIAADVWFLWSFENILPDIKYGEWEDAVSNDHPAIKALSPILKRYPGLMPLLILEDPESLEVGSFLDLKTYNIVNLMPTGAFYHIKKCRYENWSAGYEMQFYSEGPAWLSHPSYEPSASGGLSTHYSGYLAFPIGHLGVQEAWSLVSETMQEDTWECKWENPEEVMPADLQDNKAVQSGGGAFPPDPKEFNAILGAQAVFRAYNWHRDMELPARPFEGFDSPAPMYWARYYLWWEWKFPMPGEFVALVCKTMPFVLWWAQQSQPFIYSGNWFETEFYTSGIVLEKYEPDEEAGQISFIYKVLCKGEEIYIYPTDFLEYEEGERVAILKTVSWTKHFNWSQMQFTFPIPATPDEQIELDNYLADKTPRDLAEIDKYIAPITFYKELE